MFIAMLYMAIHAGTTSIPALMAYDFPAHVQTWLWLAFFASFAVKMPMWPVHTWLPDAHVQAPNRGVGHPGGRAAEAWRLRLPSLPVADVPGRVGAIGVADLHAVRDRGRVHQPRRAGAERHEEAHRLFVGRAHGDRDDRPLRLQPAGDRRRDDHDAQPRAGIGRVVPVRRRDLRPVAHPARSAVMAGWRSTCRAMRRSSCSSRWRRSGCRERAASSQNSCR